MNRPVNLIKCEFHTNSKNWKILPRVTLHNNYVQQDLSDQKNFWGCPFFSIRTKLVGLHH